MNATGPTRCFVLFQFPEYDASPTEPASDLEERISSVIHPQNAASLRVAEKLGMRPERTTQINGVDVVIYTRDR